MFSTRKPDKGTEYATMWYDESRNYPEMNMSGPPKLPDDPGKGMHAERRQYEKINGTDNWVCFIVMCFGNGFGIDLQLHATPE